MAARYVVRGPGLVDEDKARRIEVNLALEPVLALDQDVRAVLLARVTGHFLRVIPCRVKNLCSVKPATLRPLPTSSWRSSSRVISRWAS